MSNPRSPQRFWEEVGRISTSFSLLECDKCADAVMRWLNGNDVSAKVLKLKTKRRSDLYILSNRVASGESITENGVHDEKAGFEQFFDLLKQFSQEQALTEVAA